MISRPVMLGALLLTAAACTTRGSSAAPGASPGAQDSSTRFDAVRARIRNAVAHDSLVSLTVAVAQGGGIVWEEGFGMADREHRVPATAATMYSLASVSKPLTATGVMVLVQRGTVSLDAPANRYLGAGKLTAYRGNADSATVRRLLTHMSGLPTYARFFFADEPYRRPSMDETIQRYGILVRAPGEAFEYSNLGFGILDHVIERVSSTPYESFMRTAVFLPLGMTHTVVGVDPSVELVAAHRYDSTRHPIPFYDFDHRGASAIYSSAHDMARFGMFQLKDHLSDQQPILPDSAIDEMHAGAAAPTAGIYALAWGVRVDSGGLRTFAHAGGMPGVATAITLVPERDIAIVVLANNENNAVYDLPDDIMAAMLPEFAARLARQRREHPGSTTQPRLTPAFVPPGTLVGSWAGHVQTYAGALPITLVMQRDGRGRVTLGEEPEAVLDDLEVADDRFTAKFAGTFPTEDARRHPHEIYFRMRLRADTLDGWIGAAALKPRANSFLPSWISLIKAPSGKGSSAPR